jgi:DNA/RNA-binding domain of Phe-tRNA-synthetase-like protein
MSETLPQVRHELPGWQLLWARFTMRGGAEEALGALRRRTQAEVRARWPLEMLAQQPTVAAIRALFRQAGCDPTRYRPSSEALLRRVLKGEDLPCILPAVDLNNLLSIELAVPACVMDARRVAPPLVLRAGRPGERMLSMRGDFDLEGKPLLEDGQGVFGTPITDSERVKVQADSMDIVLVAYLPAAVGLVGDARACLERLLAAAPVGVLHTTGTSG